MIFELWVDRLWGNMNEESIKLEIRNTKQNINTKQKTK